MDLVSTVPVLPRAYLESSAGRGLADCYEALVQASTAEISNELSMPLERLVRILLPAATLAVEWGLSESAVLARGLILNCRDEIA